MLGGRRLPRQVVLLANKLVVVEDVKFFAGRQLLPTDKAGEAVEVEHFLAGLSDEVRRRYAVPTAAALRSVSPVGEISVC